MLTRRDPRLFSTEYRLSNLEELVKHQDKVLKTINERYTRKIIEQDLEIQRLKGELSEKGKRSAS